MVLVSYIFVDFCNPPDPPHPDINYVDGYSKDPFIRLYGAVPYLQFWYYFITTAGMLITDFYKYIRMYDL